MMNEGIDQKPEINLVLLSFQIVLEVVKQETEKTFKPENKTTG